MKKFKQKYSQSIDISAEFFKYKITSDDDNTDVILKYIKSPLALGYTSKNNVDIIMDTDCARLVAKALIDMANRLDNK